MAKKKEKHTKLNHINSLSLSKTELCLRGTDENDEDLTIWFDAFDFVNWIDHKQIDYIKERLIEHIKKL
jgi:hypothetical protein